MNNIKGITVEIGGNAENLNSALKDVNKAANGAQSELKEVNKQLKFDPKNVTLSGQKIDLLKQKSEALEEKQKTLKAAVDQAHEAFEKGDIGADKVRAVEREYEKVNSQLKETKQDLAEAQTHSNSFVERAKGKFSELKYKIKDTFSAENIKAGLGAAGVAVGAFLKGSIEEASEAEQGNADLAQSLKSTKGAAGMTMESLEDLSESLSKNTTFEDDAVKSGEAMLLKFTQIGKDVFPQAAAATLDYAQKMGVDAKSAALTLGKALNDPATGLSKLTRSGVTFTDAQKKQITAMQKAGDTAGAQKLMIAELNKEFGGQAAAAADTYAGKQKQIANQIKEVKKAIGAALMPALLKIAKAITPIIQKTAEFVTQHPKLTAAILAVIAVIGTLVGGMSLLNTVMGAVGIAQTVALGPILLVVAAIAALAIGAIAVVTHWKQVKTFFVGLWDTIKGLFGNIGAWFTSVFSSAASGVQGAWSGITGFFSGIWSGITGAFADAPGFFSDLGGKISGAFQKTGNFLKENWKSVALGIVNPVAGAATLLYKYNPGFKAWADSVMATIKNGFTSGINAIKGAFAAAINAIKAVFTPFFTGLQTTILSIWTPIKNGLMQAWDGIKTAAQGAWEIIKNVIMGPILLLIDLLTGNFGKFKDDLANIWSNIQEGGAAFASGFVQIFTGLWGAISGAAKVFAQMVVQVFVQTWNDITAGIKTAWSAITSFFSSTWDAISGGIKAFWNALPGFFSNLWVTIRNGITAAWNAVLQFFAQLWVNIGNGIKSAWNGFWATINGLNYTIKTGVINIWNSVISWFRNLPGTLRTIGANMFTSMQNGVNSTINNVTSAIKTGIGAAIDWIKALPGEAIQWGRDIINGIVQGIKDAADAVGDAVKGVAQNIRKFLHFSEPDEGPLVGFGSWMPDMMDQIVSGIKGNLGRVSSAANEVAQAIAASIPALDSSAQVHVALAAAYGGYSAPAPANAAYSDSSTASGGVVINQHNEINSPKALSPAEISRNRRNENRQLVLALKKV